MPDEHPNDSWLVPGYGAEYQLAEQDDVTVRMSVTHPDRCAVRGNPPAETAEVQRATERMFRLAGN
jgi:hypothetical protein